MDGHSGSGGFATFDVLGDVVGGAFEGDGGRRERDWRRRCDWIADGLESRSGRWVHVVRVAPVESVSADTAVPENGRNETSECQIYTRERDRRRRNVRVVVTLPIDATTNAVDVSRASTKSDRFDEFFAAIVAKVVVWMVRSLTTQIRHYRNVMCVRIQCLLFIDYFFFRPTTFCMNTLCLL